MVHKANRMKLVAIFGVLCILGVISAEKIRYDGHRVYQIFIDNEKQLEVITMLKDSLKFNFWKPFRGVGSDVHIMVNPDYLRDFNAIMKVNKFKQYLLIKDVQKLIDDEAQTMFLADQGFDWRSYHSLAEIENWLDSIIAKYPEHVTGYTIGNSFEGRPIRGVKISYKTGNPGIFIESNIHAREWITSATATYFINELLTSNRTEIRDLAENIDWYIIPVFNVDGFTYSHETDRMWRKTRQPNTNSTCIGTDGNRNFDSYWMVNNGASSDPCSGTFAGPIPFSEPETKALSEFVASIKDKLNIYLAFHSYGQYLLSPYGHTKDEFPKNYDDMQRVAKATTDAIRGFQYSTAYTYGSSATALYIASGTSVDWAYNTQDIGLGYTFEFRDKGRYGFVLPAVHIIPNCEEAIQGIIALVNEARILKYLN